MIDHLLSELTVDGSGAFEVDPAAALAKLREGVGSSPQYVITRLCSGLIGLGGDEIWVRTSKRGLLVALKNPSRPFTPEDLARGAMGGWGQSLRALGLGLLAAHSLKPRCLLWLDWTPRATHLTLLGKPEKVKNPWGKQAALAVWLGLNCQGWSVDLRKARQLLHFAPLPIRHNSQSWADSLRESPFCPAFVVYAQLAESSPDGVLGVRQLGLAEVEMGTDLGLPRASGWNVDWGTPNTVVLRLVEGDPQAGPVHRASLVIAAGVDWPQGLVAVHRGLEFGNYAAQNWPEGLRIYAPADDLPTDLTQHSLVVGEQLQQWIERQEQRVQEVLAGWLARREAIADQLGSVKSLLPLARFARSGSIISAWSAQRRAAQHQLAWQSLCEELAEPRPWQQKPLHLLAALNALGGPVHYTVHRAVSAHGTRDHMFFQLPQANPPEDWWEQLQSPLSQLASAGSPAFDWLTGVQGLARQLLGARLVVWAQGQSQRSLVWGKSLQFLQDFSLSSPSGITAELVLQNDTVLKGSLMLAASQPQGPLAHWQLSSAMLGPLRRALDGLARRRAGRSEFDLTKFTQATVWLAWSSPDAYLHIYASELQPCWLCEPSGWKRYSAGQLPISMMACSNVGAQEDCIFCSLTRFNCRVQTLEQTSQWSLMTAVEATQWDFQTDLQDQFDRLVLPRLEALGPQVLSALQARDEDTLKKLLGMGICHG